jgi:hypothetical protein
MDSIELFENKINVVLSTFYRFINIIGAIIELT